jgi:glutathione S-transferase
VLGVLEMVLKGKKWLVGDRITFADIAFSTWNDRIDSLILCAPEAKFDGFPRVKEWHERIISRPSWKTCMDKRTQLMDEQGLLPNGMPKGVSNMEEYNAKIKADAETARKQGRIR